MKLEKTVGQAPRNDLLVSESLRGQIDVCSDNCSLEANKRIDSVLLAVLKKIT